MGKGLIIALAASLGLNFFAAGFVLHDVLNPRDQTALTAPDRDQALRGVAHGRGLMGAAESLPPQSRRAFRAAFRQALPDMRVRHRDLRARQGELVALFQAERWDDDAIAAKMAEIRDIRAGQQQAFDTALSAAMGALAQEDRDRLLEAARQRRVERQQRRRPPAE